MFNSSINQGTFPTDLKITKTIPVPKNNNNDLDGFRPISITPVFSKVFEKIVHSRLCNFLSQNNILNPSQFGFQSNLSTSSAISSFLKDLLTCIEAGEHTLGLFEDLKKAFEIVCHTILLDKLERYGIRGIFLAWLKSYLTHRIQFVQVTQMGHYFRSEFTIVKTGVPQGSILGPLLFILYINDLHDHLMASVGPELALKETVYVDDINLLFHSNDPAVLVNIFKAVYKALVAWVTDNKLVINNSKTHAISFHHKSNKTFSSDLPNITFSSSTKFLGINIDSNLKWTSHVFELTKKLNSSIYALRCLSKIASEETLKVAYHGVFESKLRYGIEFWGFCSLADFERLFVLQKRALRIVWGLGYRDSCRERFLSEGVLTLPCLLIYHSLLFVYKNPQMFQSLNHNYNTRNKTALVPERFKLNLFKNSIFYYGPKFFNSLPPEIKNATSLRSFKTRVVRRLAEGAYYSIREALGEN